MPINGLIFDYGGVLWDMRFEVTRLLERQHGLRERLILETLYGTDTWRRLEVGVGDREQWLTEAHSLLEAEAGRALPPLHRHWRQEQQLILPNIHLIERLRPPYRTSVLSNADNTLMRRLTEDHRIHHLFDDIICSADVGMAKPEPHIYALAAKRLGLPPQECVFIDDLEANVNAAREAGMHGICFRIDLGHSLEEQLAGLGVRVAAPGA
ncbi:MAG: HAD family phosphatase [Dehalococcoidia bacterium]